MKIKTTVDYTDALTRLGMERHPEVETWAKTVTRDGVELQILAFAGYRTSALRLTVRRGLLGRDLCHLTVGGGATEGGHAYQCPADVAYLRALHAALGLLLETALELEPARSMRLEGQGLGGGSAQGFGVRE